MAFMDRLKNLKEKTKTKGKDSFAKLKEKYRRKKNLREINNFIKTYGKNLGPERTLQEIKVRWGEAWADLETRRKIAEMTRTSFAKVDWKKPSEKKPEKKEKKPEKEEEPEEGKKKKRFYKPGVGTSLVIVLSGAGALYGFIAGMPVVFIIVFAFIAGFLMVSLLFNKPKFILLLPLLLVIIGGALYYTGQYEVFLTQPVVANAVEQIEEAKDTIILEGNKVYEKVKCYSKYIPDEVNACLEELEKKEKEEIANPWKTYETLEVKRGNPYQDYDYIKPEDGQSDYDLELTFINKNEETFKINLTSISVELDGQVGTGLSSYVLDPTDEKYMRFNFDPIVCDSNKFKVNVTSRQTGGGTSEYALAPDEEKEEWRKELRGFRPSPIADPGPLNIYAFTYPPGIPQTDGDFKLIIKIKNPKVKGTARLEELYLIQKFSFPYKYFDIDETTCKGANADDQVGDKCQDNTNNNCLRFTFPDEPNGELSLSKGESKEIKCDATIDTSKTLDGVYKDLIRVESTYDFIQNWEFPSECTLATMSTGFQCPRLGNTACPAPYSSDKCCCLCWDEVVASGLNNKLGEGSTYGCDDSRCTAIGGGSLPEGCYCP